MAETIRKIHLRNDEFAGEPTRADVVFELFLFLFFFVLVYLVFEPVTAEVEVDLGLGLDNRRHEHRHAHRDQLLEDRRGRRPS